MAEDISESRMRFLWLSSVLPYPPMQGGAIDYSRSVLESLAECAAVQVLAFRSPAKVSASSAFRWDLVKDAQKVGALSILSRLPRVAYRQSSGAFLAAAIAAMPNFDFVVVDFISMAWIVRPITRVLARQASNAPRLIMVTHNHEASVRWQMVQHSPSRLMVPALALDAWKACRLEREAVRLVHGITCITSADQVRFEKISAVPSVVLSPSYTGPKNSARQITGHTPKTVVILGNRDAAHKRMVLSRTLSVLQRTELPLRARVDIAGSGDLSEYVRRFPGFHFQGFVEDLQEYSQEIRLGLLTDDIGGGFKIRVMTYAFLRIPMLALHIAVEGMGLVEGVHYVGASNVSELATSAIALLDDIDRLNRLQNEAFEMAAAKYDPTVPGSTLRKFAGSLNRTVSAVF